MESQLKRSLAKFLPFILLLIFYLPSAWAMEMAITVDDLPAHGPLPSNKTRLDVVNEMLVVFKKHHLKGVYGFINGEKIDQEPANDQVLQIWIREGQLLGNHTFSHLDLAQVSAAQFIGDIQKNDSVLAKLLPHSNYQKYFRYPYLAEGDTQSKRDVVRNYLSNNHYSIAPVTIDFFDYEWNAPYVRCLKLHQDKNIQWLRSSYLEQSVQALTVAHSLSELLFKRDIKQILLIHIGSFDAAMLDQLLTAYEQAGVKFIPLAVALQDDAYQINPNVVQARTYTFLNEIRLAKDLKNPRAVSKIYKDLPEAKLASLCR